jgi:hypothetical protein
MAAHHQELVLWANKLHTLNRHQELVLWANKLHTLNRVIKVK